MTPNMIVSTASGRPIESLWEAFKIFWDAFEGLWDAFESFGNALEAVWDTFENSLGLRGELDRRHIICHRRHAAVRHGQTWSDMVRHVFLKQACTQAATLAGGLAGLSSRTAEVGARAAGHTSCQVKAVMRVPAEAMIAPSAQYAPRYATRYAPKLHC